MKLLKGFAALSAAVLLCSAAMIPASAADTPQYQKGDVNMDGTVNELDAQLIMEDYTDWILDKDHILTEEQLALADVDGESVTIPHNGNTSYATIIDAMKIMQYSLAVNLGYENVTFANAWEFIAEEENA